MTDAVLNEKIEEWLKWDKNPKTKAEIENLVNEQNYGELKSRLLERMEFGTAGLRSRMGAGYTMMNDLTIIQTGQGFLEYLKEQFGLDLHKYGIIIGYDARHNSNRFAKLTANIFLRENVPVYLFRQITPTPFVPYGILKYKCCAGIMVTASHNPKEDNGYKVYFNNGAQIIPPHDQGIAGSILKNLEPKIESWNIDCVDSHPLRKDPYDEVYQSYFEDLKNLSHRRENNSKTSLKITYTAMHGVGHQFSIESFKSFNLNPFIPVVEQVQPDPEFPTVKFPNPEEGKSSLNLAIKTANENDSTLIVANDPDADRLAIAEKLPNGEWKIFNGNEIATLLGWWIWFNYKQENPNTNEYKDVYMLYSTVSSHILKSIAQKEGFNCEDTLTGFKWMGNRAHELLNQNKKVIFCFEEAIGFMCGSRVLDKDGISAEAVCSELAVFLKEVENKSLIEKLDWIYDTYGYHVSNNSYYLCYEQHNIVSMFEKIRHHDPQNEDYTYPEYCGRFKIDKIRDLTAGLVVDFKDDGKRSTPNFPTSKSSQMITFYFENGCVLTIRTSGTEPKIKWYSEIKETDKSKSREEIKNELDELVQSMIAEFYKPEVHNLKARST
ncbi:unnamed protein product [Brachionus calyciflorus]|uniref:Phosphoglucomutase 2 n=1 Tax=Brachionus calyciflorus TaxID=104777 RepID=A0A813SRG2_9BILA|nr:unnamed protein product [Brachionus calyciflorus]